MRRKVIIFDMSPEDEYYVTQLRDGEGDEEFETAYLQPDYGEQVYNQYQNLTRGENDVASIEGIAVPNESKTGYNLDWNTVDLDGMSGLTYEEEQEEKARKRAEFLENDPMFESPLATVAKSMIADTADELER